MYVFKLITPCAHKTYVISSFYFPPVATCFEYTNIFFILNNCAVNIFVYVVIYDYVEL